MEYHSPEYLNKRLRDYGVAPGGRPYFRLVLSHTQFEKRSGHRTESGILLGENLSVIREVPKYSYLPKNVWVLEVLAYMIEGDKRTNPELLTDTSYEPLWSFTAKDEDGSYLPPVLPVLKEVIRVFKTVTSSKSDAEEAERKQDEADIKRDVEILEEEGSTPITSHLSMGSGIIVPRNYE